ncbi:MAG: endonuclease/exonuclease/phosphatase family protein [Bacteroidetes bacterium]|nr:endonuclease/exonuclease/phosphatase family protein [Bacteroidota bacterium]
MKNILTISSILFWIVLLQAQQQKYSVETVAFYNVENLFDHFNDPKTRDDDRTPNGRDRWTEAIFEKKLVNTAKVIGEIGKDVTGSAPALIGLSEVENLYVVERLVASPALKKYNYGIAHFESPDERGIDVCLLYQKSKFTLLKAKKHFLPLFDSDGSPDYTRDQLVVSGLLGNEVMYFIVHHWPSRSGGQARSEPKRMAAAELNRKTVDSIRAINPKAKIINMGDFNDDPTNKSVLEVLGAIGDKAAITENTPFFNPMAAFYKKGIGTSCYRDKWNVLDQVHLSPSLLTPSESHWYFWRAGIFNQPFLINKKGRYKGYPFRSFAGGRFTNGYSDHFPVYALLLKKLAN